eukprot:2341022-Pleurochrysis_carterae.AAC.1
MSYVAAPLPSANMDAGREAFASGAFRPSMPVLATAIPIFLPPAQAPEAARGRGRGSRVGRGRGRPPTAARGRARGRGLGGTGAGAGALATPAAAPSAVPAACSAAASHAQQPVLDELLRMPWARNDEADADDSDHASGDDCSTNTAADDDGDVEVEPFDGVSE